MSRPPKFSLLEEEIALLVRRFGIQRVRAALAKFSIEGDDEPHAPPRKTESIDKKPAQRTVVNILELIRRNHPEKYRLLSEFLSRLKDRQILPEAQDIRLFAQLVGLKEIRGKSRTDMIPSLMRFLIEQPYERLRSDLQSAGTISEQQRQRGFSVLADKLIGKS